MASRFTDILSNTLEPLSPSFFERDTVTVAKALLGQIMWVQFPSHTEGGSKGRGFRIVETEAYTQDDPACHAYNRTKGRAQTLYKKPGLAYVYLIYGMYDCLNVVTEPEGRGGAVLFRAVEPMALSAVEDFQSPRQSGWTTHGPGRLTRRLGICRALHNEIDLTETNSPIWLGKAPPFCQTKDERAVVQTTRVGISKGQEYPWRFYLRDSQWVSQRDKAQEFVDLSLNV